MSKGIIDASVDWDDDFVLHTKDDPDKFCRLARVRLADTLQFTLRVLADRKMLDWCSDEEIAMHCNQAIGKCLTDFVTGAVVPVSGDVVEMSIPVESPINIDVLTPDEFQSLKETPAPDVDEGQTDPALPFRFRFGSFLYFKEQDGEPVISRRCQGADNENDTCGSFDLFVNVNSPELLNFLRAFDDLTVALLRVGVATDLVDKACIALSDFGKHTPCYMRGAEEREKAEELFASLKISPKTTN